MPKTPTSAGPRQDRRHNPLSEEYQPTSYKQKAGKQKTKKSEDDENNYVDSKSSRKILQLGQDLADEEEQEQKARQKPVSNPAFDFSTRFQDEDEFDEEDAVYNDEDVWGDEEEEEEIILDEDVDPNDLDIFNRFNPSFDDPILRPGEEMQQQGTNLADLILEKIAAHEAAQSTQPEVLGGGPPEDAIEIPAKVVEVYTKCGLFLSRYKSGKLPKPFKILPTVGIWETLISITRPDSWTPNATYEATKIFISSKPAVAQPFLTEILLPAVRADIHDNHRLNVHLYKALKKSLYRPAAFFKGLIFPLLTSRTCTQREAHIIASVIARVSVPVLHSAAALHRLCEIAAEQMSQDVDSAGATNIFIRTLLEKKYALPFKVVDALVFHFLRFRGVGEGDKSDPNNIEGKLPVIWHQGLLAFAQRYRNDITEDQREALLDLLLVKGHKTIGPEVRRELLEGRGRGVAVEPQLADGGDDTMVVDG